LQNKTFLPSWNADQSELSFAIPEMHRLISGFAKEIVSVGQFFDIDQNGSYPYHHFRVLLSRHAEQVAAYGTNYINGKTVPSYLVLPQLKDNAKATVEIFQNARTCISSVVPGQVEKTYGWKVKNLCSLMRKPRFGNAKEGRRNCCHRGTDAN